MGGLEWRLVNIARYLTSLFSQENNNLAELKDIEQAPDLDEPNEEGLCYVHIASQHGQLDILKELHSRGANLCQLDANGESGIHWATRKGHSHVIEFLLSKGVPANVPNNNGDLPFHLAAKENYVESVALLCCHCKDINEKNELGETALHLATMRGYPDIVRCLKKAGADLNITDKHGCTALHIALRKRNTSAAMVLLQENCSIEIVDSLGETPIHIVAREGLLPLAQTLCAFGCKVEIPNKFGDYPLHLATRSGNIEMVRCLCLAGCNVEIKNKEGVVPEVVSLAHGYDEIAELLNKLRNDHHEEYISQLIPSTNSVSKIKLKLFGHSGVGKSALVETLKCGYFTSWFRKSVGSMSPKLTRHNKKDDNSNKSSIELNSPGPGKKNLSFETQFDTYTHGIDVQSATISDIGDISIWEFSGHEAYFVLYDNFIGNTNCVHLVFFRLTDAYEAQQQQVLFWLHFLQARIAPQEPLGYCGKSAKPARVALVATHADSASCHKVPATGEYVSSEASLVLKIAAEKFGNVFDLHESVFVLDAHVTGSPAMKALKLYVSVNKEKVTLGLPKSTGFLVSVCHKLHHWRKIHSSFPAVQWKDFIKLVHSDVNPLAGDDHMRELIQQLQIMGEVVYVSSYAYDIVILDCKWLCTTVLGYLLSQESLDQARVTGIYSMDDVQLLFPEADGPELLLILEALHLCIKCEVDGETEYEFPCFNFVETLDGLWTPSSQYNAYGGLRFHCQNKYLLPGLFPNLQIYLRRSYQEHSDSENDLYQWYRGSKFCSGQLEGLLNIDPTGTGYEIKARGPSSMKADCFYFLQDLICLTEQMLSEVCPGLLVERHILSSSQLQANLKHVLIYPPARIMKVLLQDGVNGVLTNDMTGIKETILSLCFFNAPEVLPQNRIGHFNIEHTKIKRSKLPASQTLPTLSQPTIHQRRHSLPPPELVEHHKISHHDDSMVPGENFDQFHPILLHSQNPSLVLIPDLPSSQLPLLCSQGLCAVLDLPESMGRDWCMLGIVLGMTENLPTLDPGDNPAFSPTASILSKWVKQPDSTIGDLIKKLEELDHIDLIDSLLSILPMFCVFTCESKPSENDSIAN